MKYQIIAENWNTKVAINGKTFASKESAKAYYDSLEVVPNWSYDVYIQNTRDFLDREFIQKATC